MKASALATTKSSSSKRNRIAIDPAEWEARVQLAACYRILDHLGWAELIYTHTTLRVPGPDHHFLINPYGLRFDEVTASNLVKIDLEGNVVGSGEYKANVAGFIIHSALHMAREDALCVMHTHTTAGMAVAAQQNGLLPVHMYSHNFYNRIAYHDFEGPSLDLGERERLVASMGTHFALILRNHGLLTVGRTLPEAFVRMWRLERSCQIQIAAKAGGAALISPSAQTCEDSARLGDQFLTGDGENALGQMEFDSLVRLMDARDSSFRN